MAILLTGGSGRLGTALQVEAERGGYEVLAPSHRELDIDSMASVVSWWHKHGERVDLVIHAAALTGVAWAEEPVNQWSSYWTNTLGTRNLTSSIPEGVRVVYISTDYVFSGNEGLYKEDDERRPVNWYGWTKLLGEEYARRMTTPECLTIIRTTFCEDGPWPHAGAFVDQWTSKRPLSVIAPQVFRAAVSGIYGALHIGGPRIALYDLARQLSPDVEPIERATVGAERYLPRDTSLNCASWAWWQEEGLR